MVLIHFRRRLSLATVAFSAVRLAYSSPSSFAFELSSISRAAISSMPCPRSAAILAKEEIRPADVRRSTGIIHRRAFDTSLIIRPASRSRNSKGRSPDGLRRREQSGGVRFFRHHDPSRGYGDCGEIRLVLSFIVESACYAGRPELTYGFIGRCQKGGNGIVRGIDNAGYNSLGRGLLGSAIPPPIGGLLGRAPGATRYDDEGNPIPQAQPVAQQSRLTPTPEQQRNMRSDFLLNIGSALQQNRPLAEGIQNYVKRAVGPTGRHDLG
jgi:hypothetical protein